MEIFFWVRSLMEYFALGNISAVLNAFFLTLFIFWEKKEM